jgi:hypothetical protein
MTAQDQGTVVVEPNVDGFLVMFPDGHVRLATSKAQAEKLARKWLTENLAADVGVGRIEWRSE